MDNKQIIVVFRYDDYSNVTPTELEVNLLKGFREHNIPCTFSVVPFATFNYSQDTRIDESFHLSQTKATILRKALKAGIIEVALHGCTHRVAFNHGYATEFCRVDYDIQEEKITRGKLFLEELLQTKVTTFVPPWNSYDLNTVRILEKSEFSVISSGTFGPTEEHSKVKFLPATCDLLQLKEAVEAARKLSERQSLIVVLFHSYDFKEADRTHGRVTHEDFMRLLSWLTSQKDVSVKTVCQAAHLIEDLSGERLEKIKTYLKSFSLLPEFLSPASRLVYVSSDSVKSLTMRNGKMTAMFYLALLTISAAATYWGAQFVFPEVKDSLRWSSFSILMAVLLLCLMYTLRSYLYCSNIWDATNYKMARLLCVLSGMCMGIGISI